jgi:predicted Zn-dependent protease
MDQQIRIAEHRWSIGDTAGAMRELQEVLTEEPGHALAHAMLGGCLLDARRIHAALHEVEIALSLEPELFLARLIHAQVLTAHRRFAQAERALAMLVQEMPEHAALYRAMSDMLALRGEAGSEERRTWLARALELDPDSATTLADCADFHFRRGELDDAEHMATRALQASPEHLQAAWIMGEVKQAQGDVDGAREHAAWVLARNAEHRGAIALLARIKARRSPVLGLWWRFVSWVGLGGEARAIIILVTMYVAFRLTSLTLQIEGYDTAYNVVTIAWLGFVLYCLFAPVVFRRALQKELDNVRLKENF